MEMKSKKKNLFIHKYSTFASGYKHGQLFYDLVPKKTIANQIILLRSLKTAIISLSLLYLLRVVG